MTADAALRQRRLQACNQLLQLPSSTPESDMLRQAVDLAVELTGSTIGYGHFVNPDQDSIDLCAWSSGLRDHCTAAPAQHHPISEGGRWAESARTRRPYIDNDPADAPESRSLPEGHSPLRRQLGVPVLAAGGICQLMGVANKKEPYDQDDVETCQIIADQAWETSLRLRSYREAQNRPERLREAQEPRSAVDLVLWDWDPVTGSLSWDDSAGSVAPFLADPSRSWAGLRHILDHGSRAALDEMLAGPPQGQFKLRLVGYSAGLQVLRLDAVWGDRLEGHGRVLRGTLMNITAQEAERDAEYRATHDDLTGLPNLTWLLGHLKTHVGDGQNRRQGALALHLISLGGIETVATAHGQAVANAIIAQGGHRLGTLTRDTDQVVRMEGDRLALVQSGPVEEDAARQLADRAQRVLVGLPDGDTLHVRIGVAIWHPGEGVDELVAQAEGALAESVRSEVDVVVAS